MTESKLRELNKKDLVIERDYAFGIEQPKRSDDIEGLGVSGVVDVDVKLLSVLPSICSELQVEIFTKEAYTSDRNHFHYDT